MSNENEHGKCQACGKEGIVQRTYFRYDLKCECHSPNHFEIVWHCKDCVPIEPKQTTVVFNTNHLVKL